MKNSNILIFFIEGDASYTEVNFFNGVKNAGYNIKSKGMMKAVKTSAVQRNLDSARDFLDKHAQNKENVICFFFSDGDAQKDMKAIESTQKDLLDFISQNYKYIKLIKPVILNGKKFEEEIGFTFPTKSGSYRNGFNDFCKNKGFNPMPDSGWEPVFDFFKKTAYKELFEELEKQERFQD